MEHGSESRARRVPVTGIVCTAVCLLAMAGITWAVWDMLPAVVTTREAKGGRDAVEVPRLLFVSLGPAATVLVAALIVAASPLDRAIERRLGLTVGGDARARARNLNAVLVVMGLLFLAVHCLVIAVGTDAAVPVAPVAAALGGVVLATTGVLVSVSSRSWAMPENRSYREWAEAWRRAQPLAGRTMVVTGGLLTVVGPAAFVLLPGPLLGALVMAAAVVAATLVPFGLALARAVGEVRRGGPRGGGASTRAQ
ncbi:hypothetical protein [Nocardiopsis aegyptia]|uniref:DUF1648 domain-containing protein n=1 Tax=Nocardiopsis aegyptia TaxID=220378 RepID=A0A7Z0EQ50_9ACTN|nr:hypothetical protein [Nocardiopsis aegyptia]NYJ35847.1 hypothetical protein [Nocardiopsis aegyptia]